MIGTVQARAGVPVELRGYAQDFEHAITGVQFSANAGATWTTYAVENADPTCNVNWSFAFTPPRPGSYELLVRSMRADGAVSPTPAVVYIEAA